MTIFYGKVYKSNLKNLIRISNKALRNKSKFVLKILAKFKQLLDFWFLKQGKDKTKNHDRNIYLNEKLL